MQEFVKKPAARQENTRPLAPAFSRPLLAIGALYSVSEFFLYRGADIVRLPRGRRVLHWVCTRRSRGIGLAQFVFDV